MISDSEVEPSDTEINKNDENDENIEEQYLEGLLADDISIDENNDVGEEKEAGADWERYSARMYHL